MKVLDIKTDEMVDLTIYEVMKLIERVTDKRVTSSDWVSHLQGIARQYKVALPSLSELEADIQHHREMLYFAKGNQDSRRLHINLTNLTNLKKQLFN